jgi:hypothetical protein
MLKNITIGILAAILVVVIGTAAYNVIGVQAAGLAQGFGGQRRAGDNGNGGTGQGGVVTTGTGTGYGNGTGTSVLEIPASDLNADETAALLFMREEEKLARDVYNKLYATWNIPSFQNIASSEQKHMDEIGLLLTRYNLADPAQAAGVFSDARLQDLYNTLIAQGSKSTADALKVGAAIEEIDILDLQTRLAKTDNADIQQVFNNLMLGSYNHLKAFSGVYTNQTGLTYTAQYLPAETLNTILNTAGSGNGGMSRPAWAGGNGRGGTNH